MPQPWLRTTTILIPAQLAKGSGATVVASMGFTTGDIALGDATITEKHNGLTFGQLVGWYELKLLMKQNNLRDPLNNQVDPLADALNDKLKWLSEQKTSNPAAGKVLAAYEKFQNDFYPSASGEVRVYRP